MTNYILFFDAAPSGPAFWAFSAVVFVMICIAVAITAFLLLRKTLKMAFRMAIVGVILLIAIVGGIAALYLGSSSERPRPGPRPSSPTRR
ncbi:MAG TPA: hypothetical protein PLL77_00205 [Pyrinomonadaceae bacterium]|nr:hypothetical protein [Pyrinomonadaceae bacterium]